MFQTKRIVALLGLSALMLSPLATSLPLSESGAAFAGKGGEKGGDKGGDRGGGGKSGDKAGGKSKSAAKSAGTSQKSTGSSKPVAKQAKAAKATTHPSNLGKMNGALNASINAVIAHIRNGQTAKGPVGLFAGLAAADSVLSTAQAAEGGLLGIAAAYDALDAAIADGTIEGVSDVESYLAQYDPADPATQDADIDAALAALGGDAASGTGPTIDEPTEAEIAAAAAAVAEATTAVADAEAALLDAANKDEMDQQGLLQSLRDRLVGHEEEIADAVLGG